MSLSLSLFFRRTTAKEGRGVSPKARLSTARFVQAFRCRNSAFLLFGLCRQVS
ncbi:uncharacterized protein CCOS01_01010 [Colletotrichum costaricense]|uniref:Uncharacterized protein n=1 Tax=Colletotrichum costaricense TaxID=1209916 RepID=A0AAI9ZBV5_9PEZI|nr:uncharacterized protein CCOS01_01010 [Colletotrichum costaricense]KAK1539696.1 hypothetical protein CCOS01_01010 [Colletotrichum costaricense]